MLYQALDRQSGYAAYILRLIDQRQVTLALSKPVFVEYEAVLKRPQALSRFGLQKEDIDKVLAYLLSIARLHEIYFRLRPNLRDEADNIFIELAFTSGSHFLITNNVRDFVIEAELSFDSFAIVTPAEFVTLWRQK